MILGKTLGISLSLAVVCIVKAKMDMTSQKMGDGQIQDELTACRQCVAALEQHIAQTLMHLNADLSDILTYGSLQ